MCESNRTELSDRTASPEFLKWLKSAVLQPRLDVSDWPAAVGVGGSLDGFGDLAKATDIVVSKAGKFNKKTRALIKALKPCVLHRF